MENQALVAAEEFCIHHQIEISFVNSLFEAGLIEATIIETRLFLPSEELERLEKLSRLHYDLDINLEGIDTISHLLNRMNDMQTRINQLNQRLSLYE